MPGHHGSRHRTLSVVNDHDDGWYDTEDLAIPDGRGGIRLRGRALDQIHGTSTIPAAYVESQMLDHPGVSDAALVEYTDAQGRPMVCEVVQPVTWPPVSAEELRVSLFDQGVVSRYIPPRVELFAQLPRDPEDGRVRKGFLRRWLRGESVLDDVNVTGNEAP